MHDPTVLGAAERLAVSVLLGALLGWDREMRHKAAGLRTHMMVALGAAGFTLLGIEFMDAASTTEGASAIDLSRIIQGVVGGVGFLGAGAIIQARGGGAGMTTAAGIGVTASIGVACAVGEFTVAVLIAGIAFLVLSMGLWAERRVQREANDEDGEDQDG
jgi:putative Mg2+ transporter-C (MgtC) family protein